MANIEDQLRNVRTLEDIVNILAILFNNMNTISGIYYDLFLNSAPMMVPVKLYDENGVLQDREIPNVAYYKSSVLLNYGDPNGVQPANQGAFCIDTSTNNLYYKAKGSDSTGWEKVYSSNSDNFLTPTGNGSQLTNLNMRSATEGPLSVIYGGTGLVSSSLFSGLVKANGENAFSKAVADTDYVAPASMVGIVSYFAGSIPSGVDVTKDLIIVRNGWFACNGAWASQTKYKRLYDVIGDRYGSDGVNFRIPNLIGKYIKGSTTSAQDVDSVVGRHNHTFSGNTQPENEHVHGRGTFDITGIAGTSWMSNSKLQNPTNQFTGCFFKIPKYKTPVETTLSSGEKTWKVIDGKTQLEDASGKKYYGVNDDSTSPNDPGMGFQASLNWVGKTGATSHFHSLAGMSTDYNTIVENGETQEAPIENEVKHMTLIPIIKF